MSPPVFRHELTDQLYLRLRRELEGWWEGADGETREGWADILRDLDALYALTRENVSEDLS